MIFKSLTSMRLLCVYNYSHVEMFAALGPKPLQIFHATSSFNTVHLFWSLRLIKKAPTTYFCRFFFTGLTLKNLPKFFFGWQNVKYSFICNRRVFFPESLALSLFLYWDFFTICWSRLNNCEVSISLSYATNIC